MLLACYRLNCPQGPSKLSPVISRVPGFCQELRKESFLSLYYEWYNLGQLVLQQQSFRNPVHYCFKSILGKSHVAGFVESGRLWASMLEQQVIVFDGEY